MKRSRILRLVAWCAAAAAFALVLLSPASFPIEEKKVAWTRPDSAKQADELSRLAKEFQPVSEPVPRPVPEGGEELFQVSDALRPRVDFWKRVYTRIYSFQALVHDSRKPGRIFGVVDLRDEPGVDPEEFESVRRAAIQVLKRYREHLRFLTYSRFDPDKLKGERRRLYHLMRAAGGREAYKGSYETVRIQRGLRDRLRDSIIRSGRYFRRYSDIFKSRNLPEELVLLPHLESSFVYEARSYAGAVGIWQLTRAACYRLLHVSSVVDERLDPWTSAEAAAEVLSYNYRRLRSWPLAITAYNQGVNAMLRAIRYTGSRDVEAVIDRYRSRNFGFAGRNFYCAFVATIEVIRDYETYFGNLPIEPELEIKRHRLEKSASLQAVCDDLGVDPRQIAPLNPALRSPAFGSSYRLPQGVHINLPATTEPAD